MRREIVLARISRSISTLRERTNMNKGSRQGRRKARKRDFANVRG